MKELDLEIKEEDLNKYVDDFSKFASRKECRRHKKNLKRQRYRDITKRQLEKKSKRDLALIYYRMRKKLVDPSLRAEFYNRTQVQSKDDLIKEIIVLKKMEEGKIM